MVLYRRSMATLEQLFGCCLFVTMLVLSLQANGRGEEQGSTDRIGNFKSRHFDVHTDLAEECATRRIAQMESVLGKSESYWGRRLSGRITCYLIDEFKNWQASDLPTNNALLILKEIGGGTFIDQTRANRRIGRSSIIYATNQPGVVEHEVVHGYCFMAFGKNGPDWYREGMAELMAQNAIRKRGASCRPETLANLRDAKLSLRKIVSRDSFTTPLAESIGNKADVDFEVVASSWNSDDDRMLSKAKIAYAESWALCYLLHHNPNYHQRFRVLGQKIVEGSDIRFEDIFSPMMKNIDFELQMMGKSIDNGYRADLCQWPWSAAFQSIQVGRTIKTPLKACGGFQATRIAVARGQQYSVRAHGSWSVDEPYTAINANGNDLGEGRIEAIIQDGFELSDPFPLTAESDLSIARSGRLFLRCYDDWAQLADNRGIIQVRLKRTK